MAEYRVNQKVYDIHTDHRHIDPRPTGERFPSVVEELADYDADYGRVNASERVQDRVYWPAQTMRAELTHNGGEEYCIMGHLEESMECK